MKGERVMENKKAITPRTFLRGLRRDVVLAAVASFAVAAVVIPVGVQSANAVEPRTDVVQAIRDASPEVLAETMIGGGTVLPRDVSDGFEVAKDIRLTPVGVDPDRQGRDATPGIRSYGTSGMDTEFVAQSTEAGTRMMHILSSSHASEEVIYDMSVPAGTTVNLAADGGVNFTGPVNEMSYLPPAWAKDATGKSIPSHYEVRGQQLVQVVQHAGATYPVVADPIIVVVIPAYYVWKIVRCGAGGYLGWIGSGGWNWWQRALAVAGSCLVSI